MADATTATTTAPVTTTTAITTTELKAVVPDADDGLGGLEDGAADGTVELCSKDEGKSFKLEKKYAFISVLVKTSIENDPDATKVPLPGVEASILSMVVKYMNRHKGVEPPIVESPLKSCVMKEVCDDSWDADFIDGIKICRQDLYDLILAANYMDIKSLLHLGLACVASLIKGQPLDKLKDILSVEGDRARMEKKGPAKEEKKVAEVKKDT